MSRSFKSNKVRDLDLSDYDTTTRQGRFAVETWTNYKKKSANKKRTNKVESFLEWDVQNQMNKDELIAYWHYMGFLTSLPIPVENIENNEQQQSQRVRPQVKPPVPQRATEAPQPSTKPIVKRRSKTSDTMG